MKTGEVWRMSKVKTIYSHQEIKPFLKFWEQYVPEGWHMVNRVAEMYANSYKSDGSQGYPKGTRLFVLDDDDFYFSEAYLVDVFFKILEWNK